MTNIKITNAIFWSFLQKIGVQSIQFVISIFLARLLLPAEFGLMAMIWILISIGQSFIESGFGAALVQKKDVTYVDECSIFYFNIMIGFISASFMWISAPFIAHFYKQPILVSLTRVMSITLIINSFGMVQSSLLNKQINFKTQLKVSIFSNLISGIIGVLMAYKGFGVWSLVTQSLSTSFLVVVFLWIFNKWRPSLTFSYKSLKSMFQFGSKMLLTGLINILFQNLYVIIIGKLFSPTILGFYSRAQKLQELPLLVITRTVGSVSFPVFSLLHGEDDKNRFKMVYRKSSYLLVMLCYPILIGLIIVARPLVILLFTERWEACVPYLQLLCVAALLMPLQEINLNVLLSNGRSDLYFRLEVIKKIIIIVSLLITYRLGISAMIIGQIVTNVFSYFLYFYQIKKILNYPLREMSNDILPSLLLSIIMGLGIYICSFLPIKSQVGLLLIQLIGGVVFYSLLCIAFRVSYFYDVLIVLRQRINILFSAKWS